MYCHIVLWLKLYLVALNVKSYLIIKRQTAKIPNFFDKLYNMNGISENTNILNISSINSFVSYQTLLNKSS
jgi:hypothetical protein